MVALAAIDAFHAASAFSESHLTGLPINSGATAPSASATGSSSKTRQYLVPCPENEIVSAMLTMYCLSFASWFTTSCSLIMSGSIFDVHRPGAMHSPSEICSLLGSRKRGDT